MNTVYKKIIQISLSIFFFVAFLFFSIVNLGYAQDGRFDIAIDKSIESIRDHLEESPTLNQQSGALTIKNFTIQKIMNLVVPIFIVIGIMLAMFGFYSIMFNSSEKGAIKRGINFIIYGVIGILIMMSAQYFTDVIVGNIMSTGIGGPGYDFIGVRVASTLYNQIAYPFIKVLVYLALGFLFITLAVNVFKYITSLGDDIKKQAFTIIMWSILGMFLIIGSKQLVEAVYGKRLDIINENAQTLGELGPGILADKNIPIVYDVINRILGLASLIILILIIYQTLALLSKPDDTEQLTKIKKSLLYIFAGVIVIGAGYVIVNFLIVN